MASAFKAFQLAFMLPNHANPLLRLRMENLLDEQKIDIFLNGRPTEQNGSVVEKIIWNSLKVPIIRECKHCQMYKLMDKNLCCECLTVYPAGYANH